jgi:hypothetical protein
VTRDPRARQLPIVELTAFLVEAKARRVPTTSPFARGPLRWEAARLGADPELGYEVVWFHDEPVWGLAFHGGLLPEFVGMRPAIRGFLEEALAEPAAHCPVRGPGRVVRGEFAYVDSLSGDVRSFVGRDAVYWRDRPVCFFDYVGGVVAGALGLVIN